MIIYSLYKFSGNNTLAFKLIKTLEKDRISKDEMSFRLIDNVLVPVHPKPGKPQRVDCEYRRSGVCGVFIAFDPHAGTMVIQVKEHRTKADYVDFMKELAQQYTDAGSLRVV
jgi:hypothetical protein